MDNMDYMDYLDNVDLLLSFSYSDWFTYSTHRLYYYQCQPNADINELLKKIKLEYEFRTIVDEIIDTY